MPRMARIVVPAGLHHVTQRGNNRQDVFLTDNDRGFYLDLLKERSETSGLEVLGYCLMTNHVHLLVRPAAVDSMARGLGRAHWLYAQRFNAEHARSGHLWQARFYSAPADDESLFTLMRYVERNPVRAGIVGLAWKYPWSSAAVHVGEQKDSALISIRTWQDLLGNEDWGRYLREADEPDRLKDIRRRTEVGHPIGAAEFVSRLERKLGLPLQARSVGRPRKRRAEARKAGAREI